MVKAPLPIQQIMSDPNLSLTTSPFAPGDLIIKRASFRAGEVPSHLSQYLISAGTCSGQTGTVVYEGKEVPATAACVARQKS